MSQIYVGVIAGNFYEQEGTSFRTTQWGYDIGERRWFTHPDTPEASWPQRNQRDTRYTSMYITDVVPRKDPSGLIELHATYKGLKSIAGAVNKQRILPGANAQMMSIGVLSAGKSKTLLAQIPKDACTREFVTTTRPSLNGVGNNFSAPWLPAPADFSVTFVPDPDAAPAPQNYKTGWVLDDRSWEDVADSVFLVRERVGFYYPIGG